MVPLRALLNLPEIKRSVPEVVAGQAGLDRDVRWVHAGEIERVAPLLRGGELLIISSPPVGRARPVFQEAVDHLSERGLVGIAMELGADAGPDPAVVATCETLMLPLIVLHREVALLDLIEAANREIVDSSARLVDQADELHRRLTGLMLEGANASELLAVLAEAINNPVVLEKTGNGVLAHAVHNADEAMVLAGWDAFRRGLDGAPEATFEWIHTDQDRGWGRLIALAVGSDLNTFSRAAIDRAAGLIALHLLRSRQEQELTSHTHGGFLARLLDQEVEESELVGRAAEMGFRPKARFLLPIAAAHTMVPGVPLASTVAAAWLLSWEDIRRELSGRHGSVLAGVSGADQRILIIVAVDRAEERSEVADHLAATIRAAAKRHLGSERVAVVCVGGLAESWRDLRLGLREAAGGLAAAAHVRPQPWHDMTHADLDRTLWALRTNPEILGFARTRLAPLMTHDHRRGSDLLGTLEAYCEHGGRKSEAARSLHLHRQSLYDRLERIEALLNVDLADGRTLLSLHLALRVRRHIAEGTGSRASGRMRTRP